MQGRLDGWVWVLAQMSLVLSIKSLRNPDESSGLIFAQGKSVRRIRVWWAGWANIKEVSSRARQ